MITDEERREVARRLRDYTVKDLRYSDPICELVCSSEIDCIGFDSCGGSDMMPECVKLVFDRLADLIEPRVDRGALLELADDMDADGMDGWTHAVNVGGYARRIREALGADDA